MGQLKLLLYLNPQLSFSETHLNTFMRRRVIRIAGFLADLLDMWDPPALQQRVERKYLPAPMGAQLLNTIGHRYCLCAEAFLKARSLTSKLHRLADEGCGNAARVYRTVKQAAHAARALSGRADSATVEDVVPLLLSLCEEDIENCVDWACEIVVHDTSVTPDQQRERAERLMALGDMFTVLANRHPSEIE